MKNDLKRTYRILRSLLILAIGLVLLSAMFDGVLGWVIFGGGVCFAVAEVVIAWRYYRCPHCGAHIPVGQRPDRCYFCSRDLDA